MVVEIGYADRVGNVTHRQAELLALLVWDRARYLVGHCHLRDDRRAFRLDRVREARLTGEPAPEPGEPSLDGLPASLRPLALLE